MEVVANGFKILTASVVVTAVTIGALSGAVAWRIKNGLILGGLSALGVYFLAVAMSLNLLSWFKLVLLFGVPPLIMTFLISYLTALHLKAHGKLCPLWASLAALGGALILGILYGFLFRVGFEVPIWTALGVDACLILLAVRRRRLVLLGASLLIMQASGCGVTLDGSALDIDGLCSLSAAGHETHDFSKLLPELERQIGVSRSKIRVTPEGLFVPVKAGFVEESGYFLLARPEAPVKTEGTDPRFEVIRGCLYRYRIKG